MTAAAQMAGSGGAADRTARYTRVAAVLHWAIAILVAGLIIVGFYMTDLPRQTDARRELFNLHKSVGLLVLALMVLRLAWRLTHRPPPLTGVGLLNARLAGAVHGLLYLFLLAQPLSGYIASVYGKYGVKFFGLPLPAWGHDAPAIREPFLQVHHAVAVVLVTLIAAHLIGSVWHALQGRTDILRRMWPWAAN